MESQDVRNFGMVFRITVTATTVSVRTGMMLVYIAKAKELNWQVFILQEKTALLILYMATIW